MLVPIVLVPSDAWHPGPALLSSTYVRVVTMLLYRGVHSGTPLPADARVVISMDRVSDTHLPDDEAPAIGFYVFKAAAGLNSAPVSSRDVLCPADT